MKTGKKESKTTDSKRYTKWVQFCLLAAVVLNGVVLTINIHLSNLHGELQDKRYDEQYFVINDQTRRDELAEHRTFSAYSNSLVMLMRLTDNRLTPEEKNLVFENISELKRLAEESQFNATVISYLQANDPPEGTDVSSLFRNLSDSDHVKMRRGYEKQNYQYLVSLKDGMIKLTDDITIWQHTQSTALVLSSILIIVGSMFGFILEGKRKT